MPFKKASPKKGKARIALVGGPGDGKTYTSLTFATALAGPGGTIAFVDTEHGSASKYATAEPGDGMFDFDVVEPNNFAMKDLFAKIGEAAAGGYDVLVVDSYSHYWSGKGGALDVVGGNFNKWKDVTPVERRLVDAFLAYPGHVILCMRGKGDYEDVIGSNGKPTKQKVGVKPDQREAIEFEFDVVAYMGRQGADVAMSVTKTRCPALHGEVITNPDGAALKPLIAWLDRGEPDDSAYWTQRIHNTTDPDDLMTIYNELKEKGQEARWTSLLGAKKDELLAKQQTLVDQARVKSRPDGEWGPLDADSGEQLWQDQANNLLGKPEEFELLIAWARECGTFHHIEAHVKLFEEDQNAPI
jgi:hypothetical protein